MLKLQLHSKLSPADALAVLTDFSPSRSKVWPGVDDEHLKVHEQGADSADVTEVDKTTWGRERYTWDAATGTVTATTTDANVWGSGQWLGPSTESERHRDDNRRHAHPARQGSERRADRRPAAGRRQVGGHQGPGRTLQAA